jgi:peptidoglycan hydrolase-like protein with peptidoglycan-binding domain
MTRHLLAALLAAGALATAPAIAQQTSQSTQPTQSGEISPLQLSKQQITQLQQKLHQQNLYSGPTDGKWGPEIQAAVESFQKKENLPATGKLDTQTMAKLGLNMGSGGASAITGSGSSSMPQSLGGSSTTSGNGAPGISGNGASQRPQH